MSASSDSIELYADDPEWADIEPVRQYENPNPLAPIFYTEEYRDATDYFRGVVKKGDMSPRVLDLTEKIIRLNPAHYSAWQYRYKVLLALKSPLDLELRLMDELAVKFLKTYQVWHHRRLLISHPQLSSSKSSSFYLTAELRFIAKCLVVDSKNYHTWSYRQWLLSNFFSGGERGKEEEEVWKKEMEWIEQMIEEDVRNNSVWHHRFFVVFQSGIRVGDEDREVVRRREIDFAKDKISLAPSNPSAWNYLRGVLDNNNLPYSDLSIFVRPYAQARSPDAEADEVIDLENPSPSKGAQLPCVPAIEFLADVYESGKSRDDIEKAAQLWKSLANEYDTIRKKYWEYRIKEALEVLPA
ncbi:hypothetical protein JAAARDRAFT_34190 [Jaapia argillacea MUCL 33604]|uniref:Protein farnesyltransferase/geranylgeranyltransferase type-1 subunit alpha n=1 Tax=Jaapia argillacea MUCL 33604 TaxID=933084 RepID=A0A067PX20_9AGAM|nr:hypothetical protein JAAARDRAFT_34190 [Jaapia argillacea MUCL 33604]